MIRIQAVEKGIQQKNSDFASSHFYSCCDVFDILSNNSTTKRFRINTTNTNNKSNRISEFLGIHFPTDIKGWITTIAEITIAVGFIFLILEYKTARKDRQIDKARHQDEELEKCDNQYYEMLAEAIEDPTLGEIFIEMDLGEPSYYKKISASTIKQNDDSSTKQKEPDQAISTKQKLYNFAERIYYLCGRVHYLTSQGYLKRDSYRWKDWDQWIGSLMTSETFRGVHIDAFRRTPDLDFVKHYDNHLKKWAAGHKPDPKIELAKTNIDSYEKFLWDHVEKIPDSCKCTVCDPKSIKELKD